MKLIFEKSCPGRKLSILPPLDVNEITLDEKYSRKTPLYLPQVSENDISRHYSELSKRTFGVNCGFYPLGSCTMKYNPKINEESASLEGFSKIHPLQPTESVQGCLEVLHECEKILCEVTGMNAMSFQPAAGAHGEFLGLLLIKAYHESRNDLKRKKILVPDSAHGTNPASAAMTGFEIVNIPSTKDGCVDLDSLQAAVGDDTAGLMLTNPNTVGIFDKNILKITEIIHNAGGLNYYDGANLNAIMGVVRPGDMGFDVIHMNIHKTFSTPHGGGGPGSGPVGCKEFLKPFLPNFCVKEEDGCFSLYNPEMSIGSVRAFYGNFLVIVKAYTYLLSLGADGIKEAAQNAVLNANYMLANLKEIYTPAYDGLCMHEFVLSLENIKKETGVSALDVSKALLDNGMHPPTMYFPQIVHEALMIEPTETESKEMLDEAINIFKNIYKQIMETPELLHQMPQNSVVKRLDEVRAARFPIVKYDFSKEND